MPQPYAAPPPPPTAGGHRPGSPEYRRISWALFLAGLATGMWGSTADVAAIWQQQRAFSPDAGRRDDAGYARWRTAVERSRGWAGE